MKNLINNIIARFKYHKKNAKAGNKVHLHKSPLNYNPFMLRDNSYLEHLQRQLKLRNSREASVSLRKDMIEANNRANFQGEVDKIKRELLRPNLPYSTKEELEHRLKGYRELFQILNSTSFYKYKNF